MYDVDGNGWIDLVEMTKIVKSIYKMMGPNQALVDQFETPEKRAEDIFHRMDANSDGRVTRQEFVRSCLNDSKLAELLSPRWKHINIKQHFHNLSSFVGSEYSSNTLLNHTWFSGPVVQLFSGPVVQRSTLLQTRFTTSC